LIIHKNQREKCKEHCRQRYGCTHFAWTNENGGTCLMKIRTPIKYHAISKKPGSNIGKNLMSSKFPSVKGDHIKMNETSHKYILEYD